jgi:hypothetical protein
MAQLFIFPKYRMITAFEQVAYIFVSDSIHSPLQLQQNTELRLQIIPLKLITWTEACKKDY